MLRGLSRGPPGAAPQRTTVPLIAVAVLPPTQTCPSGRRSRGAAGAAQRGALGRDVRARSRGRWPAATGRAPAAGCRSPGPRRWRRPWGRTRGPRTRRPPPGGYGATSPMSRSTAPGRTARTSSTLPRSSATHPGPLSTHSAARTASRASAELRDALGDRRLVGGAGAQQRRGGERQPVAVAADGDDADAALLAHDAGIARGATGLQPRVARAERRVAGERQLPARHEDAQAVVGVRCGRTQQERRLREVRPAREALHRRVVKVVGVVHDGHRVAAVRAGAEHVHLAERSRSHV